MKNRETVETMEPRTILVVDDQPHIIESLKFLFESENYNVITAENNQQARKKVKDHRLDLVILDIMMPEKDDDAGMVNSEAGFDLLQEWGETDSSMKGIPLVLLSAKRKKNNPEKLNHNVKAYFDKPFDMNDLVGEVNSLTGRNVDH